VAAFTDVEVATELEAHWFVEVDQNDGIGGGWEDKNAPGVLDFRPSRGFKT
jgi:hypothetical protein